MHAHAHINTYMHYKHDNFMQMAAPTGKFLGNPYDVICTCMCVHAHTCMCVHAHACMYGTCPHTPTPTPPINGCADRWFILLTFSLFDFLLKPPQPITGPFFTLSQRVKAYLLLRYCIKNQPRVLYLRYFEFEPKICKKV